MTRYYLHGGRVGTISKENEDFFCELLHDAPLHVHILIVLFAREKGRWDEKYIETCSRFQSVAGERKLSFELAQDDISVVRERMKKSDIIFIHGGYTPTLQKKLEAIPDLESLFAGKIVAGSSAGALVFSAYYYENDTDTYHTGLGFFPFGMICHWKDQEKQREYIENFLGGEEVLCIPEGSFLVKEIEETSYV